MSLHNNKPIIFCLLIITILIFSGLLISQEESVIYYPVNYEYPDANVMADDIHITAYYGRGGNYTGDETQIGSQSGIAFGYPIPHTKEQQKIVDQDTDNNLSDQASGKVYDEESGEIAGDGIITSYSKVRFVNAVPDVYKVEIWFDSYLLTRALGYSKSTESFEIQPGNVPYEIYIDAQVVLRGSINLDTGMEHIAIITGLSGYSSSKGVPDNNSLSVELIKEDPLEDQTKCGISFFNAVPDAELGALDLRIGQSVDSLATLFNNISYKSYSGMQFLEPGLSLIDIVSKKKGKPVTNVTDVNLVKGIKYYVIAFTPDRYGLLRYDEDDDNIQ